jgi:hypothetical protein
MKHKTIMDTINTLTPEERKLHDELIHECIEREESINESSKITKENMGKLNKIVYKIQGDFNIIVDESKKINLALTPTKNKEIH